MFSYSPFHNSFIERLASEAASVTKQDLVALKRAWMALRRDARAAHRDLRESTVSFLECRHLCGSLAGICRGGWCRSRQQYTCRQVWGCRGKSMGDAWASGTTMPSIHSRLVTSRTFPFRIIRGWWVLICRSRYSSRGRGTMNAGTGVMCIQAPGTLLRGSAVLERPNICKTMVAHPTFWVIHKIRGTEVNWR